MPRVSGGGVCSGGVERADGLEGEDALEIGRLSDRGVPMTPFRSGTTMWVLDAFELVKSTKVFADEGVMLPGTKDDLDGGADEGCRLVDGLSWPFVVCWVLYLRRGGRVFVNVTW